jgi:signal transduction histidine kinase/Flp pilus assembly protein TadD
MLVAQSHSLHAQYERKVDSMKALLNQPQHDTLRIARLNEISRLYNLIAPDSSLKYCNEAIGLAARAGHTKELGRAYINLGIAYDNLGRLGEAVAEFDKATTILENTPYKRVLSSAYTNRGIVYNELGRFDSALICYEYSIALKDSVEDLPSIGIVYTNIGVAYNNLGDLGKALDYFIKSRSIAANVNDRQGVADNNLNIADVYFSRGQHQEALNILDEAFSIQQELGDKEGFCYSKEAMGNNYCRLGNYQRAFQLFEEALSIAREMQLLLRIGTIEQSIGDCYAMRNDYAIALQHYSNSLEANTRLGEKKSLILNHISLGKMQLFTGSHDHALNEFLEAARMAEESHYLAGLSEAYQGISETFEKRADFRNAYTYFVKKSAVDDSLHNESETHHLMLLEVQFETERKDQQIALLNARAQLQESQNRKALLLRNVFIAGFAAALGILLLLWLYARREKRTNALLKEKNEIIRTQKEQVEDALYQLQQSQSHLIHAEKMASLGQLTAGVAHEINNPINFVSANVNPLKRNFDELVKELKNDPNKYITAELNYLIDECYQLLGGIEEGSRRTAEIVKGLRNFSRADEGDQKLVDVHEGIESSLLILNNKLKHQQIEVIKSFASLPLISCFPGQLNQVWMNLLSNAIDAIGENGKIYIATSRQNDKAVISFKDTGKGMSHEMKAKIFDPFFTTKDVGKGTGLGLSISYGIIQKHHGNIEVISKEGEGAEFIVTLPLSA